MDVSSSKVADILEDAADYLEVHGWCQGKTKDDEGRRCAMGAITAAAVRLSLGLRFDTSGQAIHALTQHLGRAGRPEFVPSWNDHPGRTADEVIDALKHTAKAVRNGEIESRFYFESSGLGALSVA